MDSTTNTPYKEERWTDEIPEDRNRRIYEEEDNAVYAEEDNAVYAEEDNAVYEKEDNAIYEEEGNAVHPETGPKIPSESPRDEKCQLQTQSWEEKVCSYCKKYCSEFRCLFADLGPGYDRTYEGVKSYFETALSQAGVSDFENAITRLTVFRKRTRYGQSAKLTLRCGETGLTLLENPPKTAVVSEKGAFIPRIGKMLPESASSQGCSSYSPRRRHHNGSWRWSRLEQQPLQYCGGRWPGAFPPRPRHNMGGRRANLNGYYDSRAVWRRRV